MLQRRLDVKRGLNTAGYISGYRGSPLGGYDTALWRAKSHLDTYKIKFQPGVNEDLAATACWGTQQVGLRPGAQYDGVFSIWYGKGPGVDRSGDALKHGNMAGTSKNGGVLVLAGDDHGAKSSTTAHQSEQALIAAMIPIFYPSSVQEYLDYGLYGFELSRFSGAWVGIKCVGDIVEGSANVSLDTLGFEPSLPDFPLPEEGVHIRWPDKPVEQEKRLISIKLKAVEAFVKINQLNIVTHKSEKKRLGIIAAGKSWLDVCQAFEELQMSDTEREQLGISVFKVSMPWPLEPNSLIEWASGFDELLIIEEMRSLIEEQAAKILYKLPNNIRPKITGKFDENGVPIVPEYGELSGTKVAQIIAGRYLEEGGENCLNAAIAKLNAKTDSSNLPTSPPERSYWFCSGCPHNSSTKVPEGSRALAGIGCHTMAVFMDRNTDAYTHMGAEGGTWIGQAPFTSEKHVFQNIGDGTYFHSGLLAIRAAVASGVNITYKILYNDAVALTGGQPMDGELLPWDIAQQLRSEGLGKIVVLSDEPDKYPKGVNWPQDCKVYHRKELERIQIELREISGVTAIIFDQTCAAEKRRRRKRGILIDPPKRVFINESVCEGCGDCNSASNCVSVQPKETELGRKRIIDQSSCNKDFSCLDGFCPSFVTVHGGEIRRFEKPNTPKIDLFSELTDPIPKNISESYNILLTGIGGTGVITTAAILGTAASIDKVGCSVLDQTGLSQKNGAVMSHIRLSNDQDRTFGTRVGTGMADLLLGFDMIVAAGAEAVSCMSNERTSAIINDHLVPIAAFAEKPDMPLSSEGYKNVIVARIGEENLEKINSTELSAKVMGDSICANIFLMGFAFQRGLIPLSAAAIASAIKLNGVSVEDNLEAFSWGRVAATDREKLPKVEDTSLEINKTKFSLDEFVAERVDDLALYQDQGYAEQYISWLERVKLSEKSIRPNSRELEEAAARNLFKVMAYKDEYEVARLFTSPKFMSALTEQFDGDYSISYNFAPPLFARIDPITGHPRKIEFKGWWMTPVLKIISRLRFLRASKLDIFGYHRDRQIERKFLRQYKEILTMVLSDLNSVNFDVALSLLNLPQKVRGYGHVKSDSLNAFDQEKNDLAELFRNNQKNVQAAE